MAFSTTVKSPMNKAERISRSLGVYAGQISMSSYATTLVECTAITRYFKPISHTNATAAVFPHGIVSMVADPVSDLGFCWRWDSTTGAFDCYYPTNVASHAAVIIVDSDISSAGTAHVDSGAGVLIHALSGSGTLSSTVAAVEAEASEANANDDTGTINFVAIGFI